MQSGGTRAVLCWHRRAGKDENCLHYTATQGFQRKGTYWHMLPQAAQARKSMWDAINPHTGRRRVDDVFPPELGRQRDQDMLVRLLSGSTWQLVGSDNYDSLVGSPPVGLVFSEYSLANPVSWAILRPILMENGGWAAFNFTPRGPNHAKALLDSASRSKDWFVQRLTVDDTGIFTQAQLDEELAELVREHGEEDGEAYFQQEYYCSFDAAIRGAIFAAQMRLVDSQKRIRRVPWESSQPVHTAWDLGIGDSNPIWFFQLVNNEIRLIDFYTASGVGLDHYVKMMREKPYVYGKHIVPHDIGNKELGTGETRETTLKKLGVKDLVVLPRAQVENRINAARSVLSRCWFDQEATEAGVNALRNYRYEYDEKNKVLRKNPLHDWCSHPADAFGYMAQGWEQCKTTSSKPIKINTSWVE